MWIVHSYKKRTASNPLSPSKARRTGVEQHRHEPSNGSAWAAPTEHVVLLPKVAVQQQQQQDEEDDKKKKQHKQQPQTASSRWLAVWVVLMCAACSNICSLDRACLSVAILPMSAEYHWPDTIKGAISGAFNIGYTVTNLLGGYLAAAYGPKRVLAMGVLIWSTFTVLTPPAAASGHLLLLMLVRAAMGVGEGVAFPCFQVLVKTCVSPDRRVRSLSLVYSGHQLGNILSLLATPPIITSMGWPWVFYCYGLLGFAWLLCWQCINMSSLQFNPTSSAAASTTAAAAAAEDTTPVAITASSTSLSELLHRNTSSGGGAINSMGDPLWPKQSKSPPPAAAARLKLSDVPWRQMLEHPAIWALLAAHIGLGVVYNIGISWLPAFYHGVFHSDVRQSAHSLVPSFALMVLVTNLSAWASDLLVNRGVLTTLRTRKLMQTLGTAGPAACLFYLASHQPQQGQAPGVGSGIGLHATRALMTALFGFLGMQAAGYACNHQDLAVRFAGVLFGLTNAASSLVGALAVYGVGWVLDATGGQWSTVFLAVAWVQVISMVAYGSWASTQQLWE